MLYELNGAYYLKQGDKYFLADIIEIGRAHV